MSNLKPAGPWGAFREETSGLAEDPRPGFMENLAPATSWPLSDRPELSVGLILLPNFTLLAFANFVEALRLAADVGDRSRPRRCQWYLMSAGREPTRSSCGLLVHPWDTLVHPKAFDYVAVVGGLVGPGTEYDGEVLRYLREADSLGKPLIGLCTGTFVLSAAGLMKGRRCCVHGYHLEEFATRFPDVIAETEDIIVDDGNRLTCAGGASAMDLAAHLIERHCGKDRALKIQHHAVVDRFRNTNHSQLPLADPYFKIRSDKVRRALFLMEQNIERPINVSEIAERAGCSLRQLDRAFHEAFRASPGRYYRDMRLNHAFWMLANTTRSITSIASESGFADGSHFARAFKSRYGISPRAVRDSGTE